MNNLIKFLDTLLAALLTGTIFGIWTGMDPRSLSGYTYLEEQQNMIKALNVLMPVTGAITILLTLTNAVMQRRNQATFILLLSAAGLFMITGLITRFGNQPINAVILTWNKSNMPSNWDRLRDHWWRLHKLRTLSSTIALVLVIWSGLRKDQS